jgi:hypothetical protein
LPGANFSAVKNPTDHCRPMWPQSRYRGRQRVYLQAMRFPPHLYTKVACTAKRNFDHECKKTFATQSAKSDQSAPQQTALFDQPITRRRRPIFELRRRCSPCEGFAERNLWNIVP